MIIVEQTTVFSSFHVFYCNRIMKIHEHPLYTDVQFSASTAFLASFLVIFSSQFHWVNLKLFYCLCSLLSISSSSFSLYHLLRPFCIFSSTIIIFASVRFSKGLCLCTFAFRSLPPWPMSVASLPPYFTPLPCLIVKQLPSVPRPGDGEGPLLFNIIANLACIPFCWHLTSNFTKCGLFWTYRALRPRCCRFISCFSSHDLIHDYGWFIPLWLHYTGMGMDVYILPIHAWCVATFSILKAEYWLFLGVFILAKRYVRMFFVR